MFYSLSVSYFFAVDLYCFPHQLIFCHRLSISWGISKSKKAAQSETSTEKEEKEDEEMKQIRKESVTPEVLSALSKLGVKGAEQNRVFETAKPRPTLLKSPSEYFPMVRRGFPLSPTEKEGDSEVMAVGWKVEITNRKEREESLR